MPPVSAKRQRAHDERGFVELAEDQEQQE